MNFINFELILTRHVIHQLVAEQLKSDLHDVIYTFEVKLTSVAASNSVSDLSSTIRWCS